MNVAKGDVTTEIDGPNAVAQHQPNFGDATEYGRLAAERFTMAKGTDLAPLLEGLEGDLCRSPHWGYVIRGAPTVTDDGGREEVDEAGDVIYWPPGHTVRADEGAEFVPFSPRHEHGTVLDHIQRKMDEGA